MPPFSARYNALFSQALDDFICATNRSCQTRHFARSLDAALRAAYKFIYHVDFLDPDGHERNAKYSAFVRDWFCLRTSQSGGGFRPYLQRFNFLNAINNVMPQMIDRTDFILNSTVEGFWTCLTDHLGAESFDTPEKGAPAKLGHGSEFILVSSGHGLWLRIRETAACHF